MKHHLMRATGNVFAVLDGRNLPEDFDGARAARELCSGRGVGPARTGELDGLLLVLPPRDGADVRMVIHNADGSRPEACGNGLRCVAKFAREQGFADSDELRIETDAGLRRARVLREEGRIVAARVSMGVPHVVAPAALLETSAGELRVALIDMGNPHCVIFVEDPSTAPVETLGPEIENHPRFPDRTNVEFASARSSGVRLRVWERGVGETAACGTGACATAVAALLGDLIRLPVEIELAGGRLGVDWDGEGEAWLTGPCEELETPAREAAREPAPTQETP